MPQVLNAAMEAGADDVQPAEDYEGAIEGFKVPHCLTISQGSCWCSHAARTPPSVVFMAAAYFTA
jgi:hypothetical protein